MLKLSQYICSHRFKIIASHSTSKQNLWKCDKCNVYCIQHNGLGTHYLHKTPHIEGWTYDKEELK